ncbi:hypothetical protein ACOMHN_066151 [Nucella lapillus]
MFSFGKVVSSFADDQRYSASVDFDASRGSPLASNKAHGRHHLQCGRSADPLVIPDVTWSSLTDIICSVGGQLTPWSSLM